MGRMEPIILEVRKASAGSHKVRILFKEGAIGYVKDLLAFASEKGGNMIEMDQGQLETAQEIVEKKDWFLDANRTFTITLTDRFDERSFVIRFEYAIKSIEAVS